MFEVTSRISREVKEKRIIELVKQRIAENLIYEGDPLHVIILVIEKLGGARKFSSQQRKDVVSIIQKN